MPLGEPADRTCHRSPRSTHAAAMLGFLQPGPVPPFCRNSLPRLPLVRGPPDLFVRVRRSSSSALVRRRHSVSLSLFLFTSLSTLSLSVSHREATCPSHGKISIGRRDTAWTEMSCRRANWHRHPIVTPDNNDDRYSRSSRSLLTGRK